MGMRQQTFFGLVCAVSSCAYAQYGATIADGGASIANRSDAFLLIGTDDGTGECINLLCPEDAGSAGYAEGWYSLACGTAVRAMTQDRRTGNVYFCDVDGLYVWNMVDTPIRVGTLRVNTTTITIVAMAMHEGKIYATRNSGSGGWPEGLYTINPANAQCELVWSYPASDWDIGGLDFDTAGNLYGVNDDLTPNGRGLYRIDYVNEQFYPVASYPPLPGGGDQTDVDALAIWNNVAYFVIDQPGLIERYDMISGTFLPPVEAPWTTSQTFCGATFVLAHPGTVPCVNCTQSCIPDCDRDRTLTLMDHICWWEYFHNEDLRADCDGNGGVTLDDYVCFRERFLDGCRGFPAYEPK
ncbi:MAG: hypothetical protein H6815_05840 [Phycisphaeraceae bacterium]|nr:hypothetical protein [Phycisphaerales bacterium]MCB9859960.1 hypothetical protein [Phycisphaeraceae bacterium]